MGIGNAEKTAMRIFAIEQNAKLGIGLTPPIREPRINRRHIDGPYLSRLNGSMHWLTMWERLLTKLGIWGAWDIEARHCALFTMTNSTDRRVG